ncbi:MAG TPA: putative PEP-binding protein, partial [Nitrospiraceae bacterium]|nr:putative PEP-binding protein [Nitrospiraceae bacterium]
TVNILESDPFAVLDREGVGALMRMAISGGRKSRPDIKLGICGEHGGDPSSIEFCHQIGLDYVSCSPYRVGIARLAAAQATLTEQDNRKATPVAKASTHASRRPSRSVKRSTGRSARKKR